MSGAEVVVPLIAAGVGAATSIHASREQTLQANKNRRLQQAQIQKQEGLQKKQEDIAETEKQKLQIEESDEQRRRRSGGRRSLISGSDVGVDKLGQRIGEL